MHMTKLLLVLLGALGISSNLYAESLITYEHDQYVSYEAPEGRAPREVVKTEMPKVSKKRVSAFDNMKNRINKFFDQDNAAGQSKSAEATTLDRMRDRG